MAGEGALPSRPAVTIVDIALEPDSRTLPIVAARRDGGEWRVWISLGGHCAELTTERARQLVQDISAVCDVIEGRHPSILQQVQYERWRK